MVNDNENWFDLLVNQTEDITTEPQFGKIGDMMAFAYGNFDGASAILQISPDDVMNTDLYPGGPGDAEWFDTAESTFTDKAMINVDIGEVWFRMVQSGSGAGTDITFKMRPRVEKVI